MKTVNKLNFKRDSNFSIKIGDFYPEVYDKLELMGYEVSLTATTDSKTGKYVVISDSETSTGRFGLDLKDNKIIQIYFF